MSNKPYFTNRSPYFSLYDDNTCSINAHCPPNECCDYGICSSFSGADCWGEQGGADPRSPMKRSGGYSGYGDGCQGDRCHCSMGPGHGDCGESNGLGNPWCCDSQF